MRLTAKGESFSLLAMSLVRAKGKTGMAAEYSELFQHRAPEVLSYWKAAIASGNLTDVNFAGPLAQYQSIAGEFDQLWTTESLIGRLGGARRVPLMTKYPVATGAPTLAWRGAATSTPKPIGAASFEPVELPPRTGSVITVVTQELAERSGAQGALLDLLKTAVSGGIDRALLNPTMGASADGPQSLTAAGTEVVNSGSTATALAGDMRRMVEAVAAAISPSTLRYPTFITSPQAVARLASVRDTEGSAAFPDCRVGGAAYLIGLPLIVSAGAVVEGSPSRDLLVLVDASQVLIGNDPAGLRLSASQDGALIMDSAPSAGAQQLTSLWQHNMVGLKVEVAVNWQLLRGGCTWMAF